MKPNNTTLLMSLIALTSLSASAQTFSGPTLAGLIYTSSASPPIAADAMFVAGSPDVAHLFTANQGTAGDSPSVSVPGPFAGKLSSLSGSYTTAAGTTVQPYWAIFVSATYDPTLTSTTDYDVLTVTGGSLSQSSLVHSILVNPVFGTPVSPAGVTLAAEEAALGIGNDYIDYVGLEIGNLVPNPQPAGTANISSITVAAPAVTPDGASTFLLLGLGFAALAAFGFKRNHLLIAK
jgi:hypothetical protein